MHTRNSCVYCGSSPTIHWVKRLSSRLDDIFSDIEKHTGAINRSLRLTLPSFNIEAVGWTMMRLADSLYIGSLVQTPDKESNDRTRCVWEEALGRGIRMQEFRLFGKSINCFVAEYGTKRFIFEGLPHRPEIPLSPAVDWMGVKHIMKENLAPLGVPVATGGIARNEEEARSIFRRIGPPAIAKPDSGSRSRHTTIHITNKEEMRRAFKVAKELSVKVLIEEELQGMVFRATVIGGKFFAALRREPPHVIGDGKITVKELINKENSRPERQGPHFHKIPEGEAMIRELARQELSLTSVPEKGRLVTLGEKVGRGEGGSNTDVTDAAHPENVALFEKIGRILDYPFIGIDFIIQDIEKPWQSQKKCGVIECNNLPFIDLHHFPMNGKPRNAAAAIWDLALPETKML